MPTFILYGFCNGDGTAVAVRDKW